MIYVTGNPFFRQHTVSPDYITNIEDITANGEVSNADGFAPRRSFGGHDFAAKRGDDKTVRLARPGMIKSADDGNRNLVLIVINSCNMFGRQLGLSVRRNRVWEPVRFERHFPGIDRTVNIRRADEYHFPEPFSTADSFKDIVGTVYIRPEGSVA